MSARALLLGAAQRQSRAHTDSSKEPTWIRSDMASGAWSA